MLLHALTTVKGDKIKRAELENGVLIWWVDVMQPGRKTLQMCG
jgi:hypothetical protein